MPENRKLRVFLCHSSQDKPIVRELYQRLNTEGWIDPWLDEEKLLPGQDWDIEIEKAVEAADAVIVCLSNNSVTKEGYVQRELKFVLDIALEKPEGTVFVIPLRLDSTQPPRRLRTWQYVDYHPSERRAWAYQRVIDSLKTRVVDSIEFENLEGNHQVYYDQNRDQVSQNAQSPLINTIEKKPDRKPLIIILSIIFAFLCLCSFFWYMDSNYLWCTFFPFVGGC